MLGKLIKYDFKYVNKPLILIHAVLLVSCIAGRLLITNRIDNLYSDPNIILFIIAFTLYIIVFMGAAYGTIIIITLRFYKNMFSDEGYLTHTLPATRGQHLLSKTITGVAWQVIDFIVVFASGFMLAATPLAVENFTNNKDWFLAELGCTNPGDFTNLILMMVVLTIFSALSSVIMIYLSIIIGQLFNSHRILAAIIAYFIISAIVSVLALIALVATESLSSMILMDVDMVFVPFEYFMDVCKSSLIVCIATTIAFYIASHILLEKKLNLN